MRYSLLDMTQRILESMDSDEVNSYSDTTESLAVAHIIRENYYRIVSNSGSYKFDGIFQLVPSGDDTKPCVMTVPSNVLQMKTLKYNISDTITDTEYRPLIFLPLEDFLVITSGYNATDEAWVDTQTISYNGQSYIFKFRNDLAPTYYTSLSDDLLLFDAYDNSQGSTLSGTRTLGFGDLYPVFTMEDSFVPILDARDFDYLLNASKAQASIELKQIENTRAVRLEKHGKLLSRERENLVDPRTALEKHKGFGRR